MSQFYSSSTLSSFLFVLFGLFVCLLETEGSHYIRLWLETHTHTKLALNSERDTGGELPGLWLEVHCHDQHLTCSFEEGPLLEHEAHFSLLAPPNVISPPFSGLEFCVYRMRSLLLVPGSELWSLGFQSKHSTAKPSL